MGTLRFADLQTRPTEVLDLTSLTLHEFRQVVTPFDAAFQTHMASWRLDGKPRTVRQYTTYKNCPRPTPEDWLWCILVSLKTYPLQVVQGRLLQKAAKRCIACRRVPLEDGNRSVKRCRIVHGICRLRKAGVEIW